MSRQLHFPVAMQDEPVTLHTVLPGTTVCAVCGASMFAMRFRYTDRPDLLERMKEVAGQDTFGMIDPVEGCVRPVRACTTPQTEAAKPQRVVSAGLTQLTANMVHAAWHNVYGEGDTDGAECGGFAFVGRLHQVAAYSKWSDDEVAAVVSVCVAISQANAGVSMELMREATEFVPGLWNAPGTWAGAVAAGQSLRDGDNSQVMTKRAFFDLLDSYMTHVIDKHELKPTHAAPGVVQ